MQPLLDADPPAIGRYRLLGRLGSGGMGQVYLGRSPGNRMVAIKTIHREYASLPEFRTRFSREVDAARQVSGAFTAPVLEADPQAELPWLATAFVAGPTLEEAVEAHGALPEPSVRTLAAGLAEALIDIHRCGLVHRDLKPANVLMAEDGPRVLDFGIARAADGLQVTSTGAAIGTPGYWSPEQVEGADLTAKSDVFSLGALLVFASSGVPAFGTGSALTLMRRVCDSAPDLWAAPEALRGLLSACLAKSQEDRPTPEQLLDLVGDTGSGAQWLPEGVTVMINDYGTLVEPLAPTREETAERVAEPHDGPYERQPEQPRQNTPEPRMEPKPAEPASRELSPAAEEFWGGCTAVLIFGTVPILQYPAGWLVSLIVEGEGIGHTLFLGYFWVNVILGFFAWASAVTYKGKGPDGWGVVAGLTVVVPVTAIILYLLDSGLG